MSASEELLTAADHLCEDTQTVMPHDIAQALSALLNLEETYLVGMPSNESLAHVQAALAVARKVNEATPASAGPVRPDEEPTP